ncbi:MAG: hypothetical protein JO232_24215 [Verrucomicrobia bacterium]|nr:hypothetical protein [Verrucomicrobiota bacterium]
MAKPTSTLIVLLAAGVAQGQIVTKPLSTTAPMQINLYPGVVTTLYFPDKVAGVFGGGVCAIDPSKPSIPAGAVVAEQHPVGSQVVLLQPVTKDSHAYMTVLVGGRLVLFELHTGLAVPDIAVTLTNQDETTTPGEIRAARPVYNQELLVGLLKRARDARILEPLYPDLYQGYAVRDADYTSDSGVMKTTVKRIHRFSKEDALVLEGTVQNETTKALQFDGRAATVMVANEGHPIKLLSCLRPIPPGKTVPIEVVIQGDYDGARANLSIENEFRLQLPEPEGFQTVWSLKNGMQTKGPISIPRPCPTPAIPLTQTKVEKEQ